MKRENQPDGKTKNLYFFTFFDKLFSVQFGWHSYERYLSLLPPSHRSWGIKKSGHWILHV